MNVLSLFDGMSCGSLALEKLGKDFTYYSSEIDKYALKVSAQHNLGHVRLGDILNWRSWDIDWSSIDLIIAGSPCQGFSLLGEQLDFDDPRSALFFEFKNILSHTRKYNPKVEFMLENVVMKKHISSTISALLNVEPITINSALVSPAKRARMYWTNIPVDGQPADTNEKLVDILEPSELDWKPATVRKGDPRPVKFTGDKALCLVANYHKGIRADGRPCVATEEGVFDELREAGKVRPLTALECERLQGVPDGYTEGVSKTQRYKMLGNGWNVPTICHVLKNAGRDL